MALISCRECKKKISNEALSCPHCGAPKLETIEEMMEESVRNMPKCPFCYSIAIKHSTAADKFLDGLLFSGKMKCLSCQKSFG